MPEFPDDNAQEHIMDIDLPADISRQIEPATPETYDKRLVQDRSGLMMQALPLAGGKGTIAQNLRVLGDYAHLICPRCKGEKFRVLCSATDNYLSIVCGDRNCGAMWPVMEMTPVQMNDNVAKRTGLWTPPDVRRN